MELSAVPNQVGICQSNTRAVNVIVNMWFGENND